MKTAFVIMPFDETHENYYKIIYSPALSRAGFNPVKANSSYSANPVLDEIKRLILECDIVLCEISTNNPNVLYELGMAHAIGKPAIIISKSNAEIPFDLKVMGIILYDLSVPKWDEILIEKIIEACKSTSSSSIKSLISTEIESNTKDIPGIIKTFKNMSFCENDILEQIRSSNEIKIFFYLGKTILAGAQKSIYDSLEKYVKSTSKIRILHSGEKNKYLTRRISLERDSNHQGWISDIRYAKEKIESLKNRSKGAVYSRTHQEAYYWTIFLFDEVAYVQPYIYLKSNTEKSPVLKIARDSNEGSLYNLYDTYFERKWDESTPSECSIEEIIGETDEQKEEGKISVSAKIIFNDLHLFVTPKRYIDEKNGVVYFHSPGGKVGGKEDFIDAIKREIQEEIDCAAEIVGKPRTFVLSDHSDIGEISLKQKNPPLYLYRSPKNNSQINNPSPSKLWTLGYEAILQDGSRPKPQKEIFAILMLSKAALKSSIERRLRVRDILIANDGSKLITSIGVSLKPHWTIEPRGLARIIASTET
jgi:hypothetical protein